MSGAAVALFSGHAGDYTALRRRLVPPYDAFYGAVVDVLRDAGFAADDTVFKSWRFSVMTGFTAVPR